MADLKVANTNPWYVLMTLYGDRVDRELHKKNREVWNAWACQGLDAETRAGLTENGVDLPGEGAWEAIKSKVTRRHREVMKKRNGAEFEYPGLPDTETIFTQRADFYSAIFTQNASFHSAIFTQRADFYSAIFTRDASFGSATFTRAASFGSAIFTQAAYFNSATFEGRAYFTNSKFGDDKHPKPALLDLTDAEIVKPASFRDAKFLNRFPDFTGAIVNEKTIFPFQKHAWPQEYPLFGEEWRPEEHDMKRIALMREAANSCAFLRHHVKGQGLPEAEYLFFSREMGFLAQIGGWWQRLPYRLFGLSQYGTSIARPVGALAVLWLVFALIYMIAFDAPGVVLAEHVPAGKGLGFSAANMFKFFGFQRTYYGDLIEVLPSALKFLAAFQTVASYVLIFFLGLGLRARFRLR